MVEPTVGDIAIVVSTVILLFNSIQAHLTARKAKIILEEAEQIKLLIKNGK